MEVKQLVVVPLIFIISTGLVNTAGMAMPVNSYSYRYSYFFLSMQLPAWPSLFNRSLYSEILGNNKKYKLLIASYS